ncbi:MAG: YchF family ATPase [Planctomycetes bacterium]|nr:YchF family ATPase [Planctomycetota bacterium]
MKIGLIGLPRSGKTTLFNAVTSAHAQVSAFAGGRGETNLATVPVADPRVQRLSEVWKPKKTVFATIEFLDFPGVEEGSGKGGAFSGARLARMREADALAQVFRNFPDEAGKPPDPAGDMARLDEELVFADLLLAETRLEKLEWGFKRNQKTPALEAEARILGRVREALQAQRPVRSLGLKGDEEKAMRGFQFLTQKPSMAFLNSSDDRFGKSGAALEALGKARQALEFAGKFEMELLAIEDPAEARMFLEDLGIQESARDRLIRFAYRVVGQLSFFTVGEDEVRAWNLREGDTALDAAGTIHTDLARGFIRAEVYAYDDWDECGGSEKKVKEKGKFRLEGREYAVRDGDVLTIRFSV